MRTVLWCPTVVTIESSIELWVDTMIYNIDWMELEEWFSGRMLGSGRW